MNRPARFDGPKKPTNISLPAGLVEEARELGINLSQACEAGLLAEVRKAKSAEWLRANRSALDWSNAYVAEHGIPLARHRKF